MTLPLFLGPDVCFLLLTHVTKVGFSLEVRETHFRLFGIKAEAPSGCAYSHRQLTLLARSHEMVLVSGSASLLLHMSQRPS